MEACACSHNRFSAHGLKQSSCTALLCFVQLRGWHMRQNLDLKERTRDLVQLLVKLAQLRALRHDCLLRQ